MDERTCERMLDDLRQEYQYQERQFNRQLDQLQQQRAMMRRSLTTIQQTTYQLVGRYSDDRRYLMGAMGALDRGIDEADNFFRRQMQRIEDAREDNTVEYHRQRRRVVDAQ